MDFRHEVKHEITVSDMMTIRQRLSAVAEPDPHAVNGRYRIRSLYFDDLTDRVLREKLDGVDRREKFRIRYYNKDTGLIHLEKKIKQDGLCGKKTEALQSEEVRAILNGDIGWMMNSNRPLVQELYSKMRCQGIYPKTIVDYIREPFVYAPGNVRVTIDYDIRTGLRCNDFFDPDCVTIPARDSPIILEVKWDNFLPGIIRDAVSLDSRHQTSFSKYAACRTYG